MEIHVLGPVGLDVQGRRVGLGSDKARILLSLLALDVGRPVALETLVDRLWDDPPARARENTHTYVSRIRRALRAAAPQEADTAAPAPVITHRTHTYTLVADPDTIDWHRYLRLADRARAASATGDDPTAAGLLGEAERLWQTPLAGLPGLWAERVRTTLMEKRRGIVATRAATEFRLGRFAESVGELSALVSEFPGDERLAAQLMIAYYGSGRHPEALQIYQDVRTALRSGFGTDPGEELVRVHQHVLSGRPVGELTGSPRLPDVGARASARSVSGQLPQQQPLVGRRTEMERIRAAIEASSGGGAAGGANGAIVTLESISGMAGVGKTALAIRAAHEFGDRFPAGALYLNLRSNTPGQEPLAPGAALATLLRQLDVPPQSIPPDIDGRAALWRKALGHRRTLLVLDDAASPDQVRPLLPGEGGCFTLITSRRRLIGLPLGHAIALDVLPAADAVALFCRFAGPENSTDTESVAEIVRMCGFLPLAIELAANRLTAHPSWNTAELRTRLSRTGDRLAQIRDGYSEIRRAFEVSYQTLSPAEQAAFRMLSLHPGPEFGPHAAAALLGLDIDATERLLESLLQCHLLQEPVPDRFRYHDLLAEYAHLLCGDTDSAERRDAAGARLLEYYLRTADHCDRLLYPRRVRPTAPLDGVRPPDGVPPLPLLRTAEQAMGWLSTERGNLLGVHGWACEYGEGERGARLAQSLADFLDGECYWADAVRLHEAAVKSWRATSYGASLCRSLLDVSTAYTATGRYGRAEEAAQSALGLAKDITDVEFQAEALRELGILYWHMGKSRQALAFHEAALELCTASEDRWRAARCQNNLGICMLYLGDHKGAFSSLQAAIDGFTLAGDRRMLAKTFNNLGNLFVSTGDTKAARQTMERGLRIAERTGSRSDRATLQINIAEVLTASGDIHAAVALCEEALPVFRALGDRKNEAITLSHLGMAHLNAAQAESARAYLLQSLMLTQSIGAALEETQAERLLGHCEFLRGHPESAVSHFQAALDLARRIDAPDEIAKAVEWLDRVHSGSSSPGSRKSSKQVR